MTFQKILKSYLHLMVKAKPHHCATCHVPPQQPITVQLAMSPPNNPSQTKPNQTKPNRIFNRWVVGLPAVLIWMVDWVFFPAIETDHRDFVPGEKKDLDGRFATFS